MLDIEIEALLEDLKWKIKDREANYLPTTDLRDIVKKIESILSKEVV